MSWWKDNTFRMIQNNLRDIDGAMDVDQEIAVLKEFGANVVQLGCGGISAFTPTEQEFQRPTPFLEGDKFGELLKKCHENGIRVIARFDVSKAHKSYLETHPEWFSRSLKGEPIFYNDTVATCLNGPYQQEKTLEIIQAIVEKYPVDGIFFNMFGYQVWDYDKNYVGICQCENCKRRFKEFSGEELPTVEDDSDPVFRKYQQFKTFTVSDILHKIRKTVKDINPNIAVSTYNDDGIDIVRCESNSAVDRPYPFWIYSASDNISSVRGSFPDKVVSNCAINAVDIPYRFMGVSKYMNQLRLIQNMANGSNLDWCIIGAFPDYPDRENFETVKEVFQFHARHETIFSSLKSDARVLLLQSAPFYRTPHFNAEYRGIFRMLKEAHIPFDVMMASEEKHIAAHLNDYDVVILPNLPRAPSQELRDALLNASATIVGTSTTYLEDPELVEQLFGVRLGEKIHPVRGSYLLTEPKAVFRSFPLRDWVYLDKECYRTELVTAESWLSLVSAAMYGPPERCFGHQVTDTGMVAVQEKKNIYFPWKVGTLYYEHGFEDFKQIFLDVLWAVRPLKLPFNIDAPNCAEILYHRIDDDRALLQIVNLSGFNGTTVTTPLPLENIHIRLNGKAPVRVERLVREGVEPISGGQNDLTLSCHGQYAAYLLAF